MTGLVVVLAVVAAVGLCVVWDRVLIVVVARQQCREADRLRREREAGPPVLGRAPRHLRAGGRT